MREDGYLFLGNAETVGQRDHLFATVSKRWRIYRRIGPARSPALDFSQWPVRDGVARQANVQPKLADIALKSLAESFAPASVLIDRNYRVLHFHGPTEDYLAQPAGAPTLDLLALARDGLRLTVRSAVSKAIADAKAVTLHAAFRSGSKEAVLVTANPVRGGNDADIMILVSFAQDVGTAVPSPSQNVTISSVSDRALEEELKAARDEMRITVEQYETTNEELTAANEEVTSVNEELQATNEELESSKEELQSLNEELSTINAQLDRKISELAEASDDLRNLLTGNEVATIFLDTELRIKWFSPAIQTLFDLIEKDVGRPIVNFNQKFAAGNLVERARAAIERLETSDQEVLADDGRSLQSRVLPYRTQDNHIAGAVATFIDISELKLTQAGIAAARDYAEAIVETVRNPLLALSGDLRVRSANLAFHTTFGVSAADTTGRLVYDLVDGQWNVPPLRTLLEDLIPNRQQIDNYEIEFDVPRLGTRCMLLNARRIASGDNDGELVLLAIEDVTERRDLARHQELLVGELSHRVKNTLAVVQSIASQTLRHSSSLELFGESFQGRLQALAGANDAVIDGSWKGVTLRHIIQRALRPFGVDEQISLAEGPELNLHPQACLALAMILHELATNAVKYGALSVRSGLVTIVWRIDAVGKKQKIDIEWTESAGPPVEAPSRRGQGTRFIERSIAYELKGTATVAFPSEGLRAALSFPSATALMPAGSSLTSALEAL